MKMRQKLLLQSLLNHRKTLLNPLARALNQRTLRAHQPVPFPLNRPCKRTSTTKMEPNRPSRMISLTKSWKPVKNCLKSLSNGLAHCKKRPNRRSTNSKRDKWGMYMLPRPKAIQTIVSCRLRLCPNVNHDSQVGRQTKTNLVPKNIPPICFQMKLLPLRMR